MSKESVIKMLEASKDEAIKEIPINELEAMFLAGKANGLQCAINVINSANNLNDANT